jgi:hypothetical protein
MGRSYERTPIAAQLVAGKDDDLIAWWKAISPSERSKVLRATLREGLRLPQPASEKSALEAMQAEMNTLRAAVAAIPSKLKAPAPSAELAQMREELGKLLEWAHYMDGLAQQLTSGAPHAPVEIAPMPSVDEARLNEREKRMKNRDW